MLAEASSAAAAATLVPPITVTSPPSHTPLSVHELLAVQSPHPKDFRPSFLAPRLYLGSEANCRNVRQLHHDTSVALIVRCNAPLGSPVFEETILSAGPRAKSISPPPPPAAAAAVDATAPEVPEGGTGRSRASPPSAGVTPTTATVKPGPVSGATRGSSLSRPHHAHPVTKWVPSPAAVVHAVQQLDKQEDTAASLFGTVAAAAASPTTAGLGGHNDVTAAGALVALLRERFFGADGDAVPMPTTTSRSGGGDGTSAGSVSVRRVLRFNIAAEDTLHYNLARHFAAMSAVMDAVWGVLQLPVAVHCMAGISRSPTLVMSWLHQASHGRVKNGDLLRMMQARRACVNPNAAFLQLLDKFAARCSCCCVVPRHHHGDLHHRAAAAAAAGSHQGEGPVETKEEGVLLPVDEPVLAEAS
jgi:hypothetical protein